MGQGRPWDNRTIAGGPGTDPLTVIAVENLSQPSRCCARTSRSQNRRIDELLHQLAEAHTAAMISGADAAALRTQLALLTERRLWGGEGGSGDRYAFTSVA